MSIPANPLPVPSRVRVSYGTASAFGALKFAQSVPMPTAQVLLGESCFYSCAYCSVASGKLARIAWPEIDYSELLSKAKPLFKRVCLQVAGSGLAYCAKAVRDFSSLCIPVSVSVRTLNLSFVRELFSSGADKVSIALDSANEAIADSISRGDFKLHLEFLRLLSKEFPGKIATHIIIGLGENEKECHELFKELHSLGITIALFAFTPVKGTPMESWKPPVLGHYRRVQVLLFLVLNNPAFIPRFNSKSELVDFPDVPASAFMTSGCADCTRPYYDSTDRCMYNYHRELSGSEHAKALSEARTYSATSVYKAGKLLKIELSHNLKSILTISIHGDFFMHPEEAVEALEQSLSGCALDKSSILSATEKALSSAEVFGFTPEDLATAILSAVR